MHRENAERRKRFGIGVVSSLLCMALSLFGCASSSENVQADSVSAASNPAEPVEINVASLKGPTSIGLVDFMQKSDRGDCRNSFQFSISGTADEILPKLVSGEVDIALIPANAASIVASKTGGAVTCIDINALGVLYVVTGDPDIDSLADLAGRTVCMTGKGTTPEYVMGYLLDEAGIADEVTLEYKSEATEIAALLKQDPSIVAVLPQPYATAVCMQNGQVRQAVSLADEWSALQTDTGSKLVTGVTVVRNEVLDAYPDAVSEFLHGQRDSVESVNSNPPEAAKLVVSYGIGENEAIAAKAISQCNLVCLTGDEMRRALEGYLTVLYERDPSSVGGSLPSDGFYFTGSL